MSKGIRAIVIGVIVAIVVGFLIGLLNSIATDTPPLNAWLFGGMAGALTAYILGNLSGNRSIAKASDEQKREALARTPPTGKALLYLYREGFVAKLAGLNLSIDGRVVAQLKAPRFTLIVVPARPLALSAAFGGLAGPQNRRSEIVVNASAGGIVVVKMTIAMGLLQGSVNMQPQPDPQAARQALASMAMTPADVPEI